MKKVLLFVVLAALLTVSSVFSQDMGVQLIGGPEIVTQSVSLDDLKLDVEAEIDGWGILKPRSFEFYNDLNIYPERGGTTEDTSDSGSEADYAILYFDITNTTLKPKDYLSNYEVKVVYDDVYEYAGWAYQQNYDYPIWNHSVSRYLRFAAKQNLFYGIKPSDNFPIDPMYEGHYIFGCTLPNAVINSKKPLRMEITIDGNELTFNIRK